VGRAGLGAVEACAGRGVDVTDPAAKEFATIATFADEMEAVIAKQFLEAAGIQASIVDTGVASIIGRAGIGTGRVILQAELADADEASEMIAKARAGELAWDQEEWQSISGLENDDVDAETELEKKWEALDWKSFLLLAVTDPRQLDAALRSRKVPILNEFLAKPLSFFIKLYFVSAMCALAIVGIVATIARFFSW
jgi:hypothetical protein